MVKNKHSVDDWGGELREIINVWELCKNKTNRVVTAGLIWHIWLDRNNHIFSSISNSIASLFYCINNVVDLWT